MDNREKAHALVDLGCTVVPFQVLPNGEKRPVGGLKWSEVFINTHELVDTYWWKGRDPQPLVAWYHPTIGAIDMDVKDDKNGWVTLDMAGLELPDSQVEYDTPSGGKHIICVFPEGTKEAVDIPYNGSKLRGVDRRVNNGLAIWYGDTVPTLEEWNALPDAPEWAYIGSTGPVDAPIVKSPEQWFNDLPKGEIGPEIRKILDFIIPGQIDHNIMRDTQFAIVAEGAKGATGALEALAEFRAMYLSGKYNTAEYEREWADGMKGLLAKVPELQQKANAPKPLPDFEMDVQERLYKLEVDREAKKRERQKYQGNPELWAWSDLENVVIEWVIEGIWYKGSLNGLVGRSQIGKTFITVAMCGAVATGSEFFGMKAVQGRVLYVAGEGKSGIAKRFKDWCAKTGQDWELVKQNIDIVTSVDTLNEAHIDHLKELASRSNYVLVIFDTLSATSSIENENDSADMWEVMQNGKKVAPDAATVFVHHPSEVTKNLPNPKPRGASAFYNDADNLVTVTVDRGFEPFGTVPAYSNGEQPKFLTLSTDFDAHGGKSKESEPVTLKGVYLQEFKPGHLAVEIVKGGFKDPDAEMMKAICEYLEAKSEVISKPSVYRTHYELRKSYKWDEVSQRTIDRLVDKAVGLGWLEEKTAKSSRTPATYQRPKLPDLSYLNAAI